MSLHDSLLHEVSVTAPRRLSQTGVQETTLDTTVLHQNAALSMADILTRHTPLFIKSYGRATESTAEFRGTSPSHTQVLWNGLKINSPMLGTVDFSTIPAYFVDEATLLHGASSLTLTGGGLGGAVSLSTLPPARRGLGIHHIQGYGSFGTCDQFLRLTHSGQRWSTSTRLAYARSTGRFPYTNYDKKTDVRAPDGTLLRSYHPTERNRSGYFHDLHALQDIHLQRARGGSLSASLWATHSLRGLPFLSVSYRDDSDFTNEQRQDALRSVLTWQQPLGTRWRAQARAGYTLQHTAYDYSTRTTDATTGITRQTTITSSRSRSQQATAQAGADFMPAPDWLLTGNIAFTLNHVRSHDRSPFHIGVNYDRLRPETALSLTARYRPSNRLALATVLRQEHYGRHLVPPIPALFAEYSLLPTLHLKFSAARNYRYPTMDDLYFQPGGNPALRPERGVSCDGGLQGQFTLPRCGHSTQLTLHGSLTAFHSRITDWIIWTPDARGYWQPANLRHVRSHGAEITLNARLQLPRGWQFHISTAYAYTPSTDLSSAAADDDTPRHRQLPYVPRHSASAAATATHRHWTLQLQWQHYSQRYTTTSGQASLITGQLRPYYMTHLTLGHQFRIARLQAAAKAAVCNLLDSEYVTVLARPMPGRHYEFFLEIKL